MIRKYVDALNVYVNYVEEGDDTSWMTNGERFGLNQEWIAFCAWNGNIYARPEASLTDLAHEIGHRKTHQKIGMYSRTWKLELAAWEWCIDRYSKKSWFDHERANAFLEYYLKCKAADSI